MIYLKKIFTDLLRDVAWTLMLVDMTKGTLVFREYHLNLKLFPQIVKRVGSCGTDFTRMAVLNYSIPCILWLGHFTDTRKKKLDFFKLKSFGVKILSSSKITFSLRKDATIDALFLQAWGSLPVLREENSYNIHSNCFLLSKDSLRRGKPAA